jgi:hypothetical protein
MQSFHFMKNFSAKYEINFFVALACHSTIIWSMQQDTKQEITNHMLQPFPEWGQPAAFSGFSLSGEHT